jgi:glycosidase
MSVFSGSKWTWNDVRQQLYLNQFGEMQPDLNFRNPAVRKQMKVREIASVTQDRSYITVFAKCQTHPLVREGVP